MFGNESYINYDKKLITDKNLENKLLLIMAYLRLNASYDGYIGLTLNHLITDIGYKPDRHEGAINDQIKIILQEMIDDKSLYLIPAIKLNELNVKQFFYIVINDEESSIFNIEKTTKYVQLSRGEYDKITKCKTKLDKARLLRIYLNIKKFVNTSDGIKEEDRVAYPSMRVISRDCGITIGGNVDDAIKELVKLNLIYKHVTGSYKDDKGNTKNANNVYALSKQGISKAEERMLDYYNVDCFYRVASPKKKQKQSIPKQKPSQTETD